MSVALDIQLTKNNFQNISFFKDKDFTFIVNGKEYKTSTLVAELISKKIRNNRNFDIGISKFHLDVQNEGDFSNFIDIIFSNKKWITENELQYITEVIQILDCDIVQINEVPNLPDLTLDNVLAETRKNEKMNNIFPKRYQDEINFIASHFYKICDDQRESISQLQLNTINDILENENLLLQDEDQLVRFLNSIYQPNSGFNYLYEHVNFTNLSNEVIKEFRSIFDKEEITEEIWQRILSRDSILISDRYLRNNIAYNNENPFAGIINYLKNIKNYNINIDSTPVYGNRDDCRPENVILFDDRTKFFHSIIKTNNGQDNWICFDFIDYKVIPNSYTIRSGRWVIGSGHPLNWKIEGSNDKETWEEIDNKNNCHELNRTHFVKNFQIENPKSHEFRYIRMKETGICADGSHYLAFDSFEIYGELIDHTKD